MLPGWLIDKACHVLYKSIVHRAHFLCLFFALLLSSCVWKFVIIFFLPSSVSWQWVIFTMVKPHLKLNLNRWLFQGFFYTIKTQILTYAKKRKNYERSEYIKNGKKWSKSDRERERERIKEKKIAMNTLFNRMNLVRFYLRFVANAAFVWWKSRWPESMASFICTKA